MGWRNGALGSLGAIVTLTERLQRELCAPEEKRRDPDSRLVAWLFAVIASECLEGFGETAEGCSPFTGVDDRSASDLSLESHDRLRRLSALFETRSLARILDTARRVAVNINQAPTTGLDSVLLAREVCRLVEKSELPQYDSGSLLMGVAISFCRRGGLTDADIRAVVAVCLGGGVVSTKEVLQ